MVVHLFLNNNKALDFLPINSIKNGGITTLTDKVTIAGGIGFLTNGTIGGISKSTGYQSFSKRSMHVGCVP